MWDLITDPFQWEVLARWCRPAQNQKLKRPGKKVGYKTELRGQCWGGFGAGKIPCRGRYSPRLRAERDVSSSLEQHRWGGEGRTWGHAYIQGTSQEQGGRGAARSERCQEGGGGWCCHRPGVGVGTGRAGWRKLYLEAFSRREARAALMV